jgi:hypothetical protein
MKQKDLVVGQDYAYQRTRGYYRSGEHVRVLETGVVRDTMGWRTSRRKDGVLVVWINEKGEKSTMAYGTRTVPCSQIVSTWEDEVQRRKDRDKVRKSQEKRDEKRGARMEAACKVLGFDHCKRLGFVELNVERLEQYGALLTAARQVEVVLGRMAAVGSAPAQESMKALRDAVASFGS